MLIKSNQYKFTSHIPLSFQIPNVIIGVRNLQKKIICFWLECTKSKLANTAYRSFLRQDDKRHVGMNYYKLLILIILAGCLIITPAVLAQTTDTADLTSTQTTQDQLEKELKDIERQIEQYSKELATTQGQKTTLANKIKKLKTKQKTLSLQIQATTLKISNLTKKITATENKIKITLDKEKELNESIAETLRAINIADDNISLKLLVVTSISDIFDEIHGYITLTDALRNLRRQNADTRDQLNKDQNKLEDQKGDATDLLQLSTVQQQELKGTLTEQNQLLTDTKGKESNYQKILADKKKRATEIRNRIYELFNTGKQVNFGQAVDIAKWAGNITGMRPAFLLAVLTQESNLGKNVGTCNRVGDPPTKSWKVIMKPTRDQEPFKQITTELGLDIETTPVSCPMHNKDGSQLGWGGAMGPAQFIPSTWMGYKDKVKAITGKLANPWDIRDAFLAAAIKLKAGGADGTDKGEWNAAMRYFAGSINLAYRFYGDNVITMTHKYLDDIAEM